LKEILNYSEDRIDALKKGNIIQQL
jgi:hypothetical protein